MTRVLFVQYTNPGGYPPIMQAAHLLADAGCDVRLLGIEIPQTSALRLPPHPRIVARAMPAPVPGIRQKLHYMLFALRALVTALWWRPHWAYVSDTIAAPIGVLLAQVARVRIVYHEHDVPLAQGSSALMRLCLRARRWLARQAPVAVTPNADRGRLLAAASGRAAPVLTVWNCPRLSDVRGQRPRAPGAPLRLIYQGSIVPDRVPLTLIEAVARTPEVDLLIVGYAVVGEPTHLDALRREVEKWGVGDRVHILGPTDRTQLLDLTARCDLGLALMPISSDDASMRFMVGASNKAFEYLACGLPLLVTDLVEWHRTFVEPGYALACDPRDVTSIARVLEWAAANRGELAAMGRRGRARVEQSWNYESQFAPVLAALVGATGTLESAGHVARAGRDRAVGEVHA